MLDRFDLSILRALQADSSAPIAELAGRVGLSPSACHRRVKQLEGAGVIAGYVAELNPHALGLEIEVFVEISLNSQSREALEAFERAVAAFDEILECHLTTGEADYVLRVAARSVADYEQIHRRCLARLPGVSSMHTRFSLRAIKKWRGYPIPA